MLENTSSSLITCPFVCSRCISKACFRRGELAFSFIFSSLCIVDEEIESPTKSKSKITHLPPRKDGDMKRRMPDNSKMLKLLNRELLPVEKGIEKILENWSK